MIKIKTFLMLSGYQLTWLMCVFGELLYNSFLPGLICGILFLLIQGISELFKSYYAAKKGRWPDA